MQELIAVFTVKTKVFYSALLVLRGKSLRLVLIISLKVEPL